MDENMVRNDGWANVVTGLGGANDKTTSMVPNRIRMDWGSLEQSFLADALVRRFIEIVPSYALRDGFTVVCDDKEVVKLLTREANRLKIVHAVKKCWTWARLYGGAAIIMGVNDGNNSESPIGSPRSVSFLRVLDRTHVHAQGVIVDDFESKHYGEPESYQVSPINGTPKVYHADRVIKIKGLDVPNRLYMENNYWGQPVMEALYGSLQKYNAVQDGAANVAADFRQAVYKIKNLEALLASGQEELLKKRMQIVETVRSVVNAMVLSSDESFEVNGQPVAGMADLVDRATLRLCAEMGIPHTILLGESPSGLGATGESERMDFYDNLESQQQDIAEPVFRRIFDTVLQSHGKVNVDYEIKFGMVWKQTPKQDADTKQIQAQADAIYAGLGLDPDVILKTRFSGTKGEEIVLPDEYFDEPHGALDMDGNVKPTLNTSMGAEVLRKVKEEENPGKDIFNKITPEGVKMTSTGMLMESKVDGAE
jgi:phage-related protein (TIGR01555 family)